YVLESEAQDIDLFTGRVDDGKCAALFKSWIDPRSVTTAFICGPEPMMLAIAGALREHGLRDDQIKFELFASSQPGRAPARAQSANGTDANASCQATVTLDGATRVFSMPKHGQSLLDAALEHNIDVPYACKAGVCSTCRAKVIEGETEMEVNHALEDYEVRQGYVLTCQCYPLSDKVVISYDQ
ncbi:MAG: 2Fe-2S iron-sulfur cluster binding domain-containing protein, partial [Mesorhizobium sp.]